MKVLWLCNMVPSLVRQSLGGSSGGGLWIDHTLADICQRGEPELHILCLGQQTAQGRINERVSYVVFTAGRHWEYCPELEARFKQELNTFRPDVVHIWGTEYAHTLAMANACAELNLLPRTVVSIQGLCSVYAGHFAEGLPFAVQHSFTIRDFLRWDNIAMQRRKYEKRGRLELQALKMIPHVIGRTPWDEACTSLINPHRTYHFCNETLRTPFYEGQWQYAACKKHRIFASSCVYSVKGFHYLLEALALVREEYPDAVVAVPGRSFLMEGWRNKLRQNSYEKYLQTLARKHNLQNSIEFLGDLSAEGMKAAFLASNVFVLPSTIENSPNSLGEAMLLGVPSVAADVGGVSRMLCPETEGYVYPSTAPYMLAYDIKKVFAMQEAAQTLGTAAREHGRKTHNPETNLRDLLAIYRSICG